MTRVQVDLGELAAFVERLAVFERCCAATRDDVERRVRDVHEVWVGVAAQSQLESEDRWRSGDELMSDAARSMRFAAAQAHANYVAAVQANHRMWGS